MYTTAQSAVLPPSSATTLKHHQFLNNFNFDDILRNSLISASISHGRRNTSLWINYARWEESQQDFNRARSQTKRVLEAHYRDQSMLLKYAEFDMRNGFINDARNVWDRAAVILPEYIYLWIRYALYEELDAQYVVNRAGEVDKLCLKLIPQRKFFFCKDLVDGCTV
ncbi:unnamed protein product [Coffea canephora]|uniref:Crooked neck-like protein 1 n=1 Tax=Coffea canephora TaxID=49390 RepID=A0A068V0P9_COFCA|nr:unnamed protein product [Coffea canephora]